ncbi:hypothetical protein MLD38_019979 [Melastoma candidum]|uniref:Uncharacterized protein n=1 Tax=Melastoma candidum TaxID=119954 RepID=A0ACB9QDE0_9MYRT|nr:hypothetical protein MLD38_019979 [Melastoma candidum]
MSSKLLPQLLRRFPSCIFRRRPRCVERNCGAFAFFRLLLLAPPDPRGSLGFPYRIDPSQRSFSTGPGRLQGPTDVDYGSLLQEGEFHRLADNTIQNLQERLEEYGDGVEIDGFDIDYGNDVLTLKLGDLGTYVINKQTPNRQIWLSSPVSGPSRFDWDRESKRWVYRRTGANLLELLESEILSLCRQPIQLS